MTPYEEVNFNWLSKRLIIGTGSYTSGLYACGSGEACSPKNTKLPPEETSLVARSKVRWLFSQAMIEGVHTKEVFSFCAVNLPCYLGETCVLTYIF